jgi:hypothetical protein
LPVDRHRVPDFYRLSETGSIGSERLEWPKGLRIGYKIIY